MSSFTLPVGDDSTCPLELLRSILGALIRQLKASLIKQVVVVSPQILSRQALDRCQVLDLTQVDWLWIILWQP